MMAPAKWNIIHSVTEGDSNMSKSLSNYQQAKAHVISSGYWVDPIQIENEQQSQLFYQNFRLADQSESGKVHYRRRSNRRQKAGYHGNK